MEECRNGTNKTSSINKKLPGISSRKPVNAIGSLCYLSAEITWR